ncbi:MAG: CheY-like chemotaxis protein [Acidimicrobiales bacterium]|jgi:CheY-like chemotaxis protein
MKNTHTILLCDDEKFVARSYIRKLELDGYTVIHAQDGEKALVCIRSDAPDLVLLDLMMPVKSGFEVLAEIQKDKNEDVKKIPILVTSNLGQQSDIDEAMKLGAAGFLIKSNISLKELAEKVQSYLPS